MRLLLDTHVVLWLLADSPRIKSIRQTVLNPDTEVFVSVASWWEVAIKAGLGKLKADVALLRQASRESGFQELPVLGEHVESLAGLPLLHRDPFDRLLVAQAVAEPMRLLTADAVLAPYSELVWVI